MSPTKDILTDNYHEYNVIKLLASTKRIITCSESRVNAYYTFTHRYVLRSFELKCE